MAKNRTRMPAGYGGIVRYFEDYKSSIEIKPGHVVLFAVVVVVVVALMHATNPLGF